MLTHAHSHAPSMMMMGIRLFASFFFVLLLFLGAVWLIRTLQRKAPSLRRENRDTIEVLTSCILAPKTTLSVVLVRGEQFLIGVTPTSINLVSRLGSNEPSVRPADSAEMIRRPSPPVTEPADLSRHTDEKGFDHLLKETIGRLRDRDSAAASSSTGRRWSV